MSFGKYGPLLHSLGYGPIPVPRGEKGPKFSNWQITEITKSRVAAWAAQQPDANVGIRTKNCPAIDVDVLDTDFANEIEAILTREGLATCVRIGAAPKRLLACRTEQPLRKTALKLVDPSGGKHQIEILGLGQQFIAYGRHPNGCEYRYTSLDELVDIRTADLPLLTPEKIDRVFGLIHGAAVTRGWSAQRVGTASHATAADDALISFSATVDDISDEQIDQSLGLFANDDADYDTFLNVGMALHHQFAGSVEGLSKWHEWASRSDKYVPETCDAKWESFHQRPASQTPITFRYVLKYASEGKALKKRERMDDIRAEVAKCQSTERLYGKIANEVGKLLESEVEIDLIVDTILKRGKELDGQAPSKTVLRRTVRLAHLSTRINRRAPEWMKPWVYVETTEQFFNLETGQALSERAFNSVHNRFLLTEADRASGKSAPEYPASVIALNQHQIKTVSACRYMPGAEAVFDIEGVPYANCFTSRAMPSMPEVYAADDLAAIQAFENHLVVLFRNPAYEKLLLFWMAWIVQNMAEHPHWAILVLGAEGGGKSFFSEVLAGVLGAENVGNVSPGAIRGEYTAWAEGKKINVVEEIRLHGENRYAVIDKVKPYVTNAFGPVRRMRMDEYTIPLVTAYLLFTNHGDALPLARMDRRFCVLTTVFQTAEHVAEFNAKSPDYFEKLFTLMHGHKGALRRHLLELKVPETFKPYGHAPFTDAKQLMIDAARGDDGDDLETLIERSSDPLVNCYVLNTTRLKQLAAQHMVALPEGPRLAHALTHAGYQFVGRARDLDGERARYWSKHPERITLGDVTGWLREYLTGRMPEQV